MQRRKNIALGTLMACLLLGNVGFAADPMNGKDVVIGTTAGYEVDADGNLTIENGSSDWAIKNSNVTLENGNTVDIILNPVDSNKYGVQEHSKVTGNGNIIIKGDSSNTKRINVMGFHNSWGEKMEIDVNAISMSGLTHGIYNNRAETSVTADSIVMTDFKQQSSGLTGKSYGIFL